MSQTVIFIFTVFVLVSAVVTIGVFFFSAYVFSRVSPESRKSLPMWVYVFYGLSWVLSPVWVLALPWAMLVFSVSFVMFFLGRSGHKMAHVANLLISGAYLAMAVASAFVSAALFFFD